MGNIHELPPTKRKILYRDQLVTLGDLETFKTELLVAIRSLLSEQKVNNEKKWLKTYEVKKLLKVSNGTLHTLRSNGTIPYSKVGGIIYYDADAINKMMEEKARKFSSSYPFRKN